MIVHVAFLGLQTGHWTPCPEAPDWEATPAHKWVMGDTDEHVWCMWCKAVVWHTWPNGYAEAQARNPQYCEHQRSRLGPACPQCPCPHPQGHTWVTDAAAAGVEYCRRCHAAQAVPGMVVVPELPQLPEIVYTGGTTVSDGSDIKLSGSATTGTTGGISWDDVEP